MLALTLQRCGKTLRPDIGERDKIASISSQQRVKILMACRGIKRHGFNVRQGESIQ
jgi:hypothetical protein